ncbi:hypothetical protein HUJ05_002110 [Dendroctonus ponderosae]|nr:hypothetical protein HUJ05_002110 [Dendroctonus ponderosae]
MMAVMLKIQEWNSTGKNYAFLWKQQGVAHPRLRDEDFAVGFMNKNETRISMWAHCYRIGAGINTNMALESMNNFLKTNQIKRKANITVETLLDKLENLVDAKMFLARGEGPERNPRELVVGSVLDLTQLFPRVLVHEDRKQPTAGLLVSQPHNLPGTGVQIIHHRSCVVSSPEV